MCRSGASPWVAPERKPGVIPCVYFLSVRDACCQAAPLTSRVLSSAVGSSGQSGRLRGLTFRRSQVFPSVEKPGLDSQLKKPTSLCEAKPASELFLTSMVLGGSEISNATEISFTMACFHPNPALPLEALAHQQVLWGLQRLLFRCSSEQHPNFGGLERF